jgi:hypothetical protein
VTVSELAGNVQYTSNPFTDWTGTLNIQSGANLRGRIETLTMDYTGNVDITWTLYNAGVDNIIGTGDDSIVPGVTLTQPIVVVANTPMNVTASSDGFNPYN